MVMIKVNRSTVKKNKDAGCTSTQVHTGQCISTIRFKGSRLIPKYFDKLMKMLELTGRGGDPCVQYKYLINEDVNIEEMVYVIKMQGFQLLGVDQNQPTQAVAHPPTPNFSFNYEDPSVECLNCGSRFLLSELESDCTSEHEAYDHSDEVCPNCKSWNCCDGVKWEQLTDEELQEIVNG